MKMLLGRPPISCRIRFLGILSPSWARSVFVAPMVLLLAVPAIAESGGRLSTAGSSAGSYVVDTEFAPKVLRDRPIGYALARQQDGRILIGGDFVQIGGAERGGIARFHPTGALDASFNALPGVEGGPPLSIALQPDERILLGGRFSRVNGVARSHIARLNRDGSLDANL